MLMGLQPCQGMDMWVRCRKSSNGYIAIPLSAGVTTANVQDNQAYAGLTSSMPLETIKKAHFMTAGPPGYEDQDLHELSMDLGFHLVCPVRRYRSTPTERIEIADFHESTLGQVVYYNCKVQKDNPRAIKYVIGC